VRHLAKPLRPPTVPFAIAQYVLLASVTVGGLNGFARCRTRR
jgi:hypothetical protein